MGWTNLVGLSVNHNFRISPFEFHAPPSSGGQHLGYLDNSSGKSTTKAYLHWGYWGSGGTHLESIPKNTCCFWARPITLLIQDKNLDRNFSQNQTKQQKSFALIRCQVNGSARLAGGRLTKKTFHDERILHAALQFPLCAAESAKCKYFDAKWQSSIVSGLGVHVYPITSTQ